MGGEVMIVAEGVRKTRARVPDQCGHHVTIVVEGERLRQVGMKMAQGDKKIHPICPRSLHFPCHDCSLEDLFHDASLLLGTGLCREMNLCKRQICYKRFLTNLDHRLNLQSGIPPSGLRLHWTAKMAGRQAKAALNTI